MPSGLYMCQKHLSPYRGIMQLIQYIYKSYTNLRNPRIAIKWQDVVQSCRKEGNVFMELWTKEHAVSLLPALAVMLLVAIALRKLLGNKPHNLRMLPVKIIAVILVVLEIGKQGLSLYRGYDLYCLPFHYCSLFVFALPAFAFYRGKHRNAVYGVVATLCSALTLMMVVYPNLIYPGGCVTGYFKDYMNFHTVTFHNLVVLAFFLILALRLHENRAKKEDLWVVMGVLGFCMIAAAMAQLLKTNYANFYSCNIPVLEAVRGTLQASMGYVVSQTVYIAIVASVHMLGSYGAYWLYRLLRRIFIPVKQSVL